MIALIAIDRSDEGWLFPDPVRDLIDHPYGSCSVYLDGESSISASLALQNSE